MKRIKLVMMVPLLGVQVWAESSLTFRSKPTVPVVFGITDFGRLGVVMDEDHDGLDDTYAETFDLDPAEDAANADQDGDGLTNEKERQLGTDPDLKDTDSDEITDSAELKAGSNPLDPEDSKPLQLVRISVEPEETELTINTVFGTAPELDLHVEAQFSDGTTRDVTDDATVESLTPLIVSVNESRVTGIAAGTGQVSVEFAGQTAEATITVTSFSPIPVQALSDAGSALHVALLGDVAYVAYGADGLRLADISIPEDAAFVSQVELADARACTPIGQLAVVANGLAGLVIVDVADVTAPSVKSELALTDEGDEPAAAVDVVVAGPYAYLAAGAAGLVVVDMQDATAPVQIAVLGDLGTARTIALDTLLDRATVANEEGFAHIVDLTDPTAPELTGPPAEIGGTSLDSLVRGELAWIAASSAQVVALDVGQGQITPAAVGQTSTTNLIANAIDLVGSLLFVAHAGGGGVTNQLHVYNASIPETTELPLVTRLDFSTEQGTYDPLLAEASQQSVAAKDGYVYVAAGEGGLQIGRYAKFNDQAGVPPRVAITSPEPGFSVTAGNSPGLHVFVQDDVAINLIEVLWNGEVVASFPLPDAPRTVDQDVLGFSRALPLSTPTASLGVRARDLGGNFGEAVPVELEIVLPSDLGDPTLGELATPEGGPIFEGGQTFSIETQASDDDTGIAYVQLENALGTVLDRKFYLDLSRPLEGFMPVEADVGDEITFTVRAFDFANNDAAADVVLVLGGN